MTLSSHHQAFTGHAAVDHGRSAPPSGFARRDLASLALAGETYPHQKTGDPGRTRTCDLLIRNSSVCPVMARVYDDRASTESMASMESRKCVSDA